MRLSAANSAFAWQPSAIVNVNGDSADFANVKHARRAPTAEDIEAALSRTAPPRRSEASTLISTVLVSELVEAKSDLAALVYAAQSGDRGAIGALYERYARMIHGILLSHLEFAEAEDVVQDVFIRAMQQLRSLRDPAAFGSWLAAIARRSATDLHPDGRHRA